jgi:hypothetical protein
MSLLDQVIRMKQQGLSDNQIIQTLQRAGNGPQQIFDAMSQAEIKGGIEGVPVSELGDNAYPENQMQMQPEPQQQPYAPQYPQYAAPQGGITNEEVEAIAESIIDEKWDELMKSMSKVIAWKEEMDNKFAETEQKFDDLQKDFDELHKSVLGRVSDYDRTMTNVSTDLKAMSTVFQKVLPGFIETVGELSQIRDDLKPAGKQPVQRPVYREEPEDESEDEPEEDPMPQKKKSIEQRF